MPLMELPVQSVVITTARGKILISPGSQLTSEQLKGESDVTDLVAPSLLHCAGMKKAIQHHPNAKKWGAPGARQVKTKIPWDEELTTEKWPYSEELSLILLKGMPTINEIIFLHKQSRTLIVTDFCFNLTRAKGFGPWFILSLFGTYRKFGVSRFFLRNVKDMEEFKKSVFEITQLDFDNIVVSHGENVIGGAKLQLIDALKQRGIIFK